MKWLAITVGVLLLGFLGYWLIELKDEPLEPEPAQTDADQLGQAPETKPAQAVAPTLADFSLEFGNLSFKYPAEWNLIEGDNTSEQQLVTIESPKDNEGYYYCVDFNEFGASQDEDLTSDELKILSTAPITASGVGKPLYGVTFQTDTSNLTISSLVDGQVQVGATSFENSITNPAGRMLQIIGRFNCREEQLPTLSLEEFENSRLYDEARQIYLNLSY